MLRTALLSAYKKTPALVDFARALREREWDLLASAGTAKFLAEHGVKSKDVASIVGEPILGHRVVTLAREIYAGLLSRDEDERELERLGISRIDLVFVDLYPLKEEIAREGATEASVIEKTDIGGPTLLRAAANGRRLALSSQAQFEQVLRFIDESPGAGPETRKRFLAGLAAEAEGVVGEYCSASAEFNRGVADGSIA